MSVYVVKKNADFTEGRGPMLLDRIYSNLEAARGYVMDQRGIMGSPQNDVMPVPTNIGVEREWAFNGFVIVETHLHDGPTYAEQVAKYSEEELREAVYNKWNDTQLLTVLNAELSKRLE